MLAEAGWFLGGVASVAVAWIAVTALQGTDSLYGDDECVALNAVEPDSRWFNMGLWTESNDTLSVAAERLFRHVATSAGIKSDSRVLELGSGHGEGARVLRDVGAGQVLQVTASKRQAQYANRQMRRLGWDKVTCLADDAVKALTDMPSESFDAIVAVDCAYHFNPRDEVLRSAQRVLRPGGKLAMTDLVLPPRALGLSEQAALRIVLLLGGVPQANLKCAAEYHATLEEQGWTDIALQDISAQVYPGFLAFVQRHGKQVGFAFKAWASLERYARVVRWYSDPVKPRLAFYTVTATKKEEAIH